MPHTGIDPGEFVSYSSRVVPASVFSRTSLSRQRAEALETMRVFGPSSRLVGTSLCVLVTAIVSACDSDDAKPGNPDTGQTRATSDSLSSARATVVADLQDRLVFVLSTSPNSPTASVYGGASSDSILTVSIPDDTNHAAASIVLQSPALVRQLWSVGYRAVSLPNARTDRTVILPLPDPSAAEQVSTSPTGAQAE